MNINELRTGLAYVESELRAIHTEADGRPLTEDEQTRWDEGASYLETTRAQIADFEAREAIVNSIGTAAAVPGDDNLRQAAVFNVNTQTASDPYDLSGVNTFGRTTKQVNAELRSRALKAIESHRDLEDSHKEAATRKLERTADPRGFIPNYVLRTGSDVYGEAFHKYLAGRSDLWSNEERHAVAQAEEVRAALSTTDANGGYAIPFTLDPTLILTNDGTINPVRRLARNETVVTDSWNGLSSAGASFSWDGEVAEVSDDSPTFAQPSVTPKKAQGFIQGSIEITQDYAGLVGDLQMIFADGKDILEGTAFIHGTGSNQPQGIITALDGGSSEVDPATAETFAIEDVYATAEALPPRFRSGASRVAWLAELSTINAMRQFATANNYHAFLTDLTAGSPRQLLGYELAESSDMDAYSDINTGAAADNHLLLIGDWRHYLVVDRVGMLVEYIPHLFNTSNNLPDGRRGWYAHWRVGADSIVDGAFRVLNVATTV